MPEKDEKNDYYRSHTELRLDPSLPALVARQNSTATDAGSGVHTQGRQEGEARPETVTIIAAIAWTRTRTRDGHVVHWHSAASIDPADGDRGRGRFNNLFLVF